MGADQAEHDRRLNDVLRRLQEWGFRLGLPKCKFNSQEVKYLGMIINSQGIRADPEMTLTIRDLRSPASIPELRSLLGLINYYGKFVERLHLYKAKFEALLSRTLPRFEWTQELEKSLDEVKDDLTIEVR